MSVAGSECYSTGAALWLAASVVSVTACLSDFIYIADGAGADGGGGGAAAMSTGGSVTSTGGHGGSGGGGGHGEAGGSGGAPPTLVDDGLVARYYLDEADGGQGPTELQDASNDPLPLAISYAPELSWVEEATGRGLRWNSGRSDGVASAAIAGTKLDTAFTGSPTATIELVVNIEQVCAAPPVCRLFHVGAAVAGPAQLAVVGGGAMMLRANWNGFAAGEFTPTPSGRVVMHLVFDTTLAGQNTRSLFVDGVKLAGSGATAAGGLAAVAGSHLALGNRQDGGRSPRATIYYAAFYNIAMGPTAIEQNRTILSANDDRPR